MSYLRRLLNQSVLLAFMLYALWVMVFAYASFLHEKEKLYAFLDQQLIDAALTAPLLLPEELHHKGMTADDLTKQQDYENTLKLSGYTDQTNIIYIYTLIIRNNKVFFTSSSATKQERESGESLTSFFDHYDDVDPGVYDIFNTREKEFLEYTDQWGTFRSAFIPAYSKDGTFYLTAADLSIADIQMQLNQHIYRTLIIALLFLFFAYPIYLASTQRVKRIAKQLKSKVQEQTSELIQKGERLQLFARVFKDAHEGIMITDTQGKIVDVNPTFCEITAYSYEDIIGQNSSILKSGKHSPEFYEQMWQSLNEHNHWHGEIWNRKKGGAIYAELLTISALKDENDRTIYYVGLFSDITQIKQQQKSLELMAHYDVLTQLPNRILFADRFSQLSAHCKRSKTLLAVCFLDIDNFKPVNDNYGHEAGDQLLIELAARIKATIREEDTVSRQGGDEFILLLGELESFVQCKEMLKRILHSLSQPYSINSHTHNISVSIGVTLYPLDDADLDTLVRHADQAMYQAKIAGKNNYKQFNLLNDKQIIEKHKQLQEIQLALSNHEFCLYYQPKVNMKTGEILGAEALIRWIHPEKGMIPPLDFLPIIENTQLETEIGEWVINEALKQLDEWKNLGIEFEISINISSYHLHTDTLFVQLDDALALYPSVNSNNFQLEILESSALGDLNAISACIKTCRNKLGVNFALDDFGTGYSSLTHLRNLSATTIKIDQSFVRDILDDPGDYSIVAGVIGLADSFNRKIIAEGVETTEQGLMLLTMGCEKAQGYGIARPMPAETIPAWLNNYTPNKEWIAFGNKEHTLKEKQIELLALTITQWVRRFKENIQSPTASNIYWPKMAKTKCYCGFWLNRARQEQLFEQDWLSKLDEVHGKMHAIADLLLQEYNENNTQAARVEMASLESTFEEIVTLLKNNK